MVIVMLGAPGTGKGTVAGILQESLKVPQISTGDIFRENIKSQTELGKKVVEYTSEGKLVPDEITVKIVEDRLSKKDTLNGAILDGFPRTIRQAEELEKMLEKQNKKVDMVINLVTPEEEIIERIVNRIVCSNQECKATFNLKLNPPKVAGICDKCGSNLVKRADDNEETVKTRIKTYLDSTSPLVEYYENKGILRTEVVSQKTRLAKEIAEELINVLKGE